MYQVTRKKIYISKEKRIYNSMFLKVIAFRKGMSGAYSQEDACLKFSQAEGNIEAIWVSGEN